MTHRPPPKPRPTFPIADAPALPTQFLARAAALPGKALAVALALYVAARAARSPAIILGHAALARFSVSPDATFDALTRMSEAGLVRTSRRRGRHAEVTITDDEAIALLTR